MAQEAGEVRLACTRDGDAFEPVPDGSQSPRAVDGGGGPAAWPGGEETEWSRWATAEWDGELLLAPVLPTRPLIVTPEESLGLLAGARARIYIRVPLTVEVSTAGPRATVLTRIPTKHFSDTWWGSVEEGELAFWLETRARRSLRDDLFQPHLAICPLELVNRSREDLPVTTIALRVEYLSLFAHRDRIWSDATRVVYAGDAEGSRLEMEGRPPEEVPEAERIAPPRSRMARGFRARTFARLRSLQDLF
jgi:hypothetical protein